MLQGASEGPTAQEWRVLRFVTSDVSSQQSVAKVGKQSSSGAVAMQTDCLAFEYTKTLAASGRLRLACMSVPVWWLPGPPFAEVVSSTVGRPCIGQQSLVHEELVLH